MRLTYILAVAIAATIHAGGSALSATKGSNHAAPLESTNVARSDDEAKADNGRLLRRVEKDDVEELVSEDEERFLKKLKESVKKFLTKPVPGLEAYRKRKFYRFADKMRKEAVRRQTARDKLKYASS